MNKSILFKLGAITLGVFLWPFWRLKPIEFAGDYSFLWYLHEAFFKGLKYGSDILITAGPWSILNYSVYHPKTYTIVLLIQVFISVLLSLALVKIINIPKIHTFFKYTFTIFIIGALSLSVDARSLVYLFMTPILYRVLKEKKISIFFLVYLFISAFVALSKGTYTIVAILNILMLFCLEYRSKSYYRYSLTLIVSIYLASLIANHSLKDLILYLQSIFIISNSYSQIFSEEGNLFIYILFISVIIICLLKIIDLELKKNKFKIISFIILFLYACYFLILIKSGFLRQDGEHLIRSIIAFPVFIFLYFMANRSETIENFFLGNFRLLNQYRNFIFFSTVVLFILGFASTKSIFDGKIHRISQQWLGLYDILISNASITKQKYSNATYDFYDVGYPKNNYTLFVSFITPFIKSKINTFNVVPGITGYMNSSNYISSKNAKFLSYSGAENLVYQYNNLDPFGDSFVSLFKNYKYVKNISDNFYLYKRRNEKISLINSCLKKEKIKWNSKIKFPINRDETKLIKIYFKRSMLDKIVSIGFKPIPVFLKKTKYKNNQVFNEVTPIEDKNALSGFIIFFSEDWEKDMPSEIIENVNNIKEISIIAGREGTFLNKFWNEKFFLVNKLEFQVCNININNVLKK